jgi:hypothetical protein
MRADQLESIRDLGGMLGLGWEGTDAASFRENFRAARELMGDGRIAFGTDMNGAAKQPGPRAGTRVRTTWTTGSRTWDYAADGVANYGMIPEFFRDLRDLDAVRRPSAGVDGLNGAAESFARVWERAELASRTATMPREPVADSVRTFTPRATDWLCPSRVVAGDREFDGHGPEIWASAELEIRDSRLEAVLTMRARETQHDWSETRGTWRIPVSPSGMRILEVLSDKHSDTHVISSPAGFQILGPGGPLGNALARPPIVGGLVQEFQIVGDTGGPDISDDDNCGDDTRMRVIFNPIRVKVLPD